MDPVPFLVTTVPGPTIEQGFVPSFRTEWVSQVGEEGDRLPPEEESRCAYVLASK